MSNVLISCPVFKREWILPYWFKAIERQNFPLDKLGFIFELGPEDDGTHEMLSDWSDKHPEFICFEGDIQQTLNHQSHPEGLRYWNEVRYSMMAQMRNNLLDKAIAKQDTFSHYFSLDSDILLKDINTINRLLAYSEQYPDAVVSPLAYMTPDSEMYPSVMSWRTDAPPGYRAQRKVEEYPIGKPFFADVVMAAVLMPKEIFTNVRYHSHRQGEDLGFAAELTEKGYRSLAASDIYVPHVMHQHMLGNHVHNWLSLT